MASADVQAVRAAYDAFNRGDGAVMVGLMDPDIEWNEPGGGNAPGGTFHGPQSVADDVLSTPPANFEEFAIDIDHVFGAFADHVVVVGTFRCRPNGGAGTVIPYVGMWQMRNGKAIRYHNYTDAAAWAPAWGGG